MSRKLAACLVATVVTAANAKCVDDAYKVAGRVVGPGGEAVPGAAVQVIWRDYLESQSLRAIAGDDGAFSLDLRVNRFSNGISLSGLYNCDFVLSSVVVAVTAPKFRGARKEATFTEGLAKVLVKLEAPGG